MLIGILIGGVLFLVGVVVLLGGRAEQQRFAKLRAISCGDAKPGPAEVKLTGAAACDKPLIAPISRKPCVLFRLVLDYDEVMPADRLDRQATRYKHESTTMRYASGAGIDDGTGRVLLDPNGARFFLQTLAVPGTLGILTDPRFDKLMRELLPPGDRYSARKLREERLDQGEEVLATGRLERHPEGVMLTGGTGLELWAGGESKLRSSNRGADLLAGALMVLGVAVALLGGPLFTVDEDPVGAGSELPVWQPKK